MSTNKAEQAVAYAALILADESIAVTPERLQALLKAAGIEDVEPIWTTLFANALKDKDIKSVLTVDAVPGVGRAATTDGTATGGDDKLGRAANEAETVVDRGETDSEDTDDDFRIGLFD